MARIRDGGEPWSVGVLCSQTGVTSVIERGQLQGTLIALEEINANGGVNGHEVVPIIYDPKSVPSNFACYAYRLLTEDNITMIFGCYTSSSRKAVLPVVERHNGLLWYPTLYEGFEYSPNIIYTGAAPNQNSAKLVQYLIEKYGTRFYLVGSDYIYPRESNRIMRELLAVHGGTVIGERYIDLRAGRLDFKPVIREVVQLQPDVIFSTVVGESTAFFYQSYSEAGFDPRTMPIASLSTCEAEIKLMGADVGEGHLTVAPYFESVDTEANRSFVSNYKARFGDDEQTNMCVEAAYFQVHVFAKALAQANSMDPDVLRPMVLGCDFEAPQGHIAINEKNNHTALWTRIARANRSGGFDIVRESRVPLEPDPYMMSL